MTARIWRFFCSVKLAVVVLGLLAASLAIGTVLESSYDVNTARYWVYQSVAFRLLLGFIAFILICVMIDRWPWKKRHAPFLLAHIGIITVLVGSWITDRFGLDGSIRITEGETGAAVELSAQQLMIADPAGGEQAVGLLSIPWTPPNATFRSIRVDEYGLVIDRFIAHAESRTSFVAGEYGKDDGYPAFKLRIEGGPMAAILGRGQDFWVWAGHPSWATVQAGPARLSLVASHLGLKGAAPDDGPRGPALVLKLGANRDVSYESRSSSGQVRTGHFESGRIQGQVIETGWKGGVKITIAEWIPRAVPLTEYFGSKFEYGDQAPPSAIHISAVGNGGHDGGVWLGLGERASFGFKGRELSLTYAPKRLALPFGIRLERFNIDRYEGTSDPASYASDVSVIDEARVRAGEKAPERVHISMNEPLHHRGITFYQASYEDAEPRPVTTILSVNRDPGRMIKYAGSLILVGGVILLFLSKYFNWFGSGGRG